VSKVAALEEMYLIYQVFRSYLTEPASWGVGRTDRLLSLLLPAGAYRWDVSGGGLGRIDPEGGGREAWLRPGYYSVPPIERNREGLVGVPG
jgi:hypothetical protein